jgi:hypothetical protein
MVFIELGVKCPFDTIGRTNWQLSAPDDLNLRRRKMTTPGPKQDLPPTDPNVTPESPPALSAGTLADGSATGVPEGSFGFWDAAGSFFSALITDSPVGLILIGVGLVGLAVAIGGAIYSHYSGALSPKQREALVDQNRDPNSEESLRAVRDASPTSTNTPVASPLYSAIVGTWQGRWCGLDTATLRISATGGLLAGTITAREMLMNQDVTSCEALDPKFTGQPQQLALGSPDFDGQILSFSVGSQRIQLQLSGNQLIGPSSGANSDPTIYRRVR